MIDSLTGRLGVVDEIRPHEIRLRPLPEGNGPAWSTTPASVRRAEEREVLTALRLRQRDERP
ncbi:hypothetical protein [Streptomyces xiaopingdaonensis]|uniref:hypothetical protein n=1 Tax=Streptomyces xiaopingdaonensis TaxID=1565415 RepID=UPI0002F8C53C|nr:hypothetical protein [Streptomyces xiaopingdaonensis]